MSSLEELLELDFKSIVERIQDFIKQKVEEAGAEGAVVGLSGGLDSSVTATLTVRALSPRRVLGLVMPDSRVTPSTDVKDAKDLAKNLQINHMVIDIAPIFDSYLTMLPRHRLAEGNLRARIRMSLLYYFANLENRLVIGTGDKSELLLGYFTKYGDGGVDILPLGSLYKTQVASLARWLGIPSHIIEKKSSPRLWPDHDAEKELGFTYEFADQVLYLIFDKGLSEDKVSRKLDSINVEKVVRRYRESAHKRAPPAIYKI